MTKWNQVRQRARRRCRCPQVEVLEDRQLLSTIAALTEQNQLIRFDSENPAAILATTPIMGLQANESILGIDVRPATGELYGLGSTGRLYVIDPLTGAATLRATLAADPTDATDPFTALAGANFGIDFNPVPDRLRVVSDANQNLRINPTTGAVITDTALAFDASDRNAGRDPNVVDVAYTNNVAGATTTTLFGIDANFFSQKVLPQPDGTRVTFMSMTLVRQGGAGVPPGTPSPNTGLLFSLGAFGRQGVAATGLDIAPNGAAFIAISGVIDGQTTPRFLFLSLDTTGTPGSDASRGTIGDGTTAIRDIAVLPSVQFSVDAAAVDEGGTATLIVTRTEGTVGTVTVDFAAQAGTATAGSDFTATSGTLTFAPGEATKTITIPILDDSEGEGDETLTVVLRNPTGGVTVGAPATVSVRINANDRRDRVGPRVLQVLETGPSRGITGFRAVFDEDLNPARAANVANYSLFGIGTRGRRTRIDLASATYDPVTRSVTVVARNPFVQTQFRQLQFRFNGNRRTGITDVAGNGLRGPRVLNFALFSGQTVTFRDRDGDQATISIANGGTLDGIRPLNSARTQRTQFWILDPIALRSTLSGTVRPRGDGIVVIAEIIGIDKKDFTPFLSNTSFQVNTLTFSSNATGIG